MTTIQNNSGVPAIYSDFGTQGVSDNAYVGNKKINIYVRAMNAFCETRNSRELDAHARLEKLEEANTKAAAARTEANYVAGLLGGLDSSKKNATTEISENLCKFLMDNNITIDGRDAASYFNNGKNLTMDAVSLTQIEAQLENFSMEMNSDTSTETNYVNMAINGMNAALLEVNTLRKDLDQIMQTVSS